MPLHTHQFVENYKDLPAFGLDRDTDRKTLIYYLQKFSDDVLMDTLVNRLSDKETEEIYNLINSLMKKHLSDDEYHSLFLKE